MLRTILAISLLLLADVDPLVEFVCRDCPDCQCGDVDVHIHLAMPAIGQRAPVVRFYPTWALSGPGAPQRVIAYRRYDLDHDGDVDLFDFAKFLRDDCCVLHCSLDSYYSSNALTNLHRI